MEKVRIQDDLYEYVNGKWLETAVIDDDKPATGGFINLADDVEKLLMNDFDEMVKDDSFPNEYLKEALALYKEALNTKKRNRLGIKPALKLLAKLKSINDLKGFNRNLKNFVLFDIALPFNISVSADMMDTNHYAVMMQGPSVILPDTTYYNEGMEAQRDQLLGIWSNMAKNVLALTDLTKEEQECYLADTLAFDRKLAGLVKSSEEWSEYTKAYNPMKLSRICSLVKPIKLKKLMMDLFAILPDKVVIAEPRYFKGFKEIFNDETFVLYKHWAYVKTLLDSTSYLSEDLRDLGGSYGRILSGVGVMSDVKKFAYRLTSGLYSEPIGLYYGDKYFGEEAKKDIVDMVHQIIDTYKKRIERNDFLAASTKEKAILKLSTMGVKMGYPDKINPVYDKFKIDAKKSLLDNVIAISVAHKLDDFSKLTKDVDRSEWVMPGHMVNACYNPFTNDITFPAAILQAPFYSIKQTRSENLGGIGAVIGHEISHAFDNNGAKCDENGNLKNWWTKEDLKHFNQKTKAMINEFKGITLPWGEVNSSLIVSENIADNGGMAVTLEIMGHMENKNYEEYFTNWARIWCMKGKEEYLKLLLAVDVHGPAILRANMQPRNFDEWYQTFNVKKTDKMYLAPNKRVVIW